MRQDMNTAFEEFTASNYDRAYRFALRLTKNADDASDLTQEAFVRALRAFDRRDEGKNSHAWLMQILYNVFLDQIRSKRRRPDTISIHGLSEDGSDYDAPSNAPDPEKIFLNAHLSEPMEKALSRISPEHRKIILHLSTGINYSVLAQYLGCRLETVKSRVHRANVSLRRQLATLDPKYAAMIKMA